MNNKENQEWIVYIIYNKNCSYVGATPNPVKRNLS